jgi:glycosyltransferase involved in cell wall biosynthesis
VNPKVTFIVPCYKLAHLLPECINSILSQTYDDFEVLIMDDASPDNTPEVAASFNDPRVKHIRNNPNLGHLKNYNHGIGLSRGEYVWLISADDRLRSPQVLERYVKLMDRHPQMGYVFCRGVGLENGKETGILKWGDCGEGDRVWSGRKFLVELLETNKVIAASGMVRMQCYKNITVFPLDLPYAGDWYLWCIFAFHCDVGYLAEPMVSYRLHELSMTNTLTRRHRIEDNLAVRWRMKGLAQQAGDVVLEQQCLESIARHYAFCATSHAFQTSEYALTPAEWAESLENSTRDESTRCFIRARIFVGIGNGYYRQSDALQAAHYYRLALEQDGSMFKVRVKNALARMGGFGLLVSRMFV